jgi:Tfp pilus assembly protein PilE
MEIKAVSVNNVTYEEYGPSPQNIVTTSTRSNLNHLINLTAERLREKYQKRKTYFKLTFSTYPSSKTKTKNFLYISVSLSKKTLYKSVFSVSKT